MSKYFDLFRDVRRWYALREGNDRSAAASAVLFMSILFSANAISIISFVEKMAYRTIAVAPYLSKHKAFTLGCLLLVTATHFAIARHMSLFEDQELISPPRFPRRARYYVAGSMLLLIVSILAPI